MTRPASWGGGAGGLGGLQTPSFCQIFAKSPFFASNFSISMSTASSRSSQPLRFQIHSAVYALEVFIHFHAMFVIPW